MKKYQLLGVDNILREIKQIAKQNKTFPHVLLVGPRGCGKTTLAHYISQLLKKELIEIPGSTATTQDVLRVLTSIKSGDVILIDEIHRLHPKVEEMLHQPLENFELVLHLAQKFKLPDFTMIGATTRPGMVRKPLASRFRLKLDIPLYNTRTLTRIIQLHYPTISRRSALIIAAHTIVPRDALNLAFRVLQFRNKSTLDALKEIGYKHWMSAKEITYLKHLQQGSRSLLSLQSILQLDKDEVLLIEDRLLYLDLIDITSKGRELTVKGLLKLRELNS